jgi:hypothetical protein
MAPVASTANLASQVPIGANGTVYIGGLAATAPTTEISALTGLWRPMGFITEDGVKITDGKDIQTKGAWQTRYPVARWITGRTYEIGFTLMQINWLTWPFAMGGGTLTEPTAGHFKYLPPSPSQLDSRSMVIDWDNNNLHYRIYIPNGIVTEPVEIDVKADDTIMLPIVFGAVFDGTNPIYSFFTDDGAFNQYSP